MQKLTLILFTLLFTNFSFGQRTENEIFEDSKGKWKMPIAKYQKIKFSTYNEQTVFKYSSFITDSSYEVSSVEAGIVEEIITTDSLRFLVIIKSGNYYVTYNLLSNLYVHRDDNIKKNQKIGVLGKNVDGEYELIFNLYNNKKNINPKAWFNLHPKFSKKKNRISFRLMTYNFCI
jgi:hypothetical protein